LRQSRPGGGQQLTKPPHQRHHLPRPPARLADRGVGAGSGGGRAPRAWHLAAARADRLRRPAPRAGGDRAGAVLSVNRVFAALAALGAAVLIVAILAIAGVFSSDDEGDG